VDQVAPQPIQPAREEIERNGHGAVLVD
jgi:hypothetical protein